MLDEVWYAPIICLYSFVEEKTAEPAYVVSCIIHVFKDWIVGLTLIAHNGHAHQPLLTKEDEKVLGTLIAYFAAWLSSYF